MGDATWLLIRHAESTWNAAGRWQGQGDPPLSDRGRLQAEALARRLPGETIDVLISSDLSRAAETAAILGRCWGLQPQLTDAVRELAIGDWTGLTRDQIAAIAPEALRRFESRDPHARPGGGESRDELERRARRALVELAAAHPGARVAVVTHLGVLRALSIDAATGQGGNGEPPPELHYAHCECVELAATRFR